MISSKASQGKTTAEGGATRIKWNEVVEQSIPVFKEFEKRGVVPTLRTIYYALVSKNILPNTKNVYKGLSSVFVDARKDGRIKWNWLADEAREVESNSDYGYNGWTVEELAKSRIRNVVSTIKNGLEGNFSMNYQRWTNQPYYVEVWIEKSALRATIQDWIGKYKVCLVPSRGYSSWTFLKEAADRIRNNAGKRKVQIIYFGDFDPSGVDIERFIRDSLCGFFNFDLSVKRYGVTPDQIVKYGLPTTPDDAEEIAKLQKDSRFANWEHGLYRVELDALLAYVPDEFETIVKEAVAEFFDEQIYAEIREKEERDTEELQRLIKLELGDEIRRVLKEAGFDLDDESDNDSDD